MTKRIGTLRWAQYTGGRLNITAQMRLLTEVVVAQIRLMLQRTAPVPAHRSIDLDAIRIPDSAMAQRSMELCEEVSVTSLFYHCLRTYFWGAILAQQNDIRYDEELFFVVAMLHDLGLTEQYNENDSTSHCYAVEGGRAAAHFVCQHGWDTQQAEHVNEAIALHLNIQVPLTHGAEAHLVHEGAALDVLGFRFKEIPPTTRTAILTRYPRSNFKHDITALMHQQVVSRPQSRIAFMHRVAQFRARIYAAPFNE
ncbi:MAG: cyanamide hydratase [Chloroflexota bacterium]